MVMVGVTAGSAIAVSVLIHNGSLSNIQSSREQSAYCLPNATTTPQDSVSQTFLCPRRVFPAPEALSTQMSSAHPLICRSTSGRNRVPHKFGPLQTQSKLKVSILVNIPSTGNETRSGARSLLENVANVMHRGRGGGVAGIRAV